MFVPVWLIAVVFCLGLLLGWLARGSDESRTTIVPPRSPAELDAQIRALVAVGQTIQAIRVYREFHPQVDLKTAKDVIEAVERGQPLPSG